MKNLIHLKLTLCTLLLMLLSSCSDDDPIQYRLTTQVSPAETGTLTPVSGLYNEGTEIELKATPIEEYIFKNWAGDASGNVNPLKVIMLEDKNITAVFEKVNYSLTIEVIGEGTVNQEIVLAKSSSKDYESGTTVQLTAVADAEWKFVEWSGDHTGTENPIQLTMDQAMSITAKFEKVQYTLDIEVIGQGTVKQEIVLAKSSTDYDPGTTVKLTAIPKDQWEFIGWSGDYEGSQNPIEIEMNEAMSLTATFEMKMSMPIWFWTVGNGSVETEWIGDPGSDNPVIKLTAHPGAGWYFVSWWGIPDNDGFGDSLITRNPLEFDLNEALSFQDSETLHVLVMFREGITDKTYVPDDDFEQALIDLGYDDQLDNYVSTQVISRIEELDVSNRNIQDLSGIEDFISLQVLRCNQNRIKNLKLTAIPLYHLAAQDNELTDLDLSDVGNILYLDIRNNLLTCAQVNEEQLNQLENPGLTIWLRDEGVEFSTDCD